jgi:hypothetical protein
MRKGRTWRGLAGRLLVAVTALLLAAAPTPAQAAFNWRGDDYNWDGYSDLLSIWDENGGGLHGCMMYHPANGSGGFYYMGFIERCGWYPHYMDRTTSAGDLNNDGLGDIAAISYEDTCLYVWWGVGDGFFSASDHIGCGWDPYLELLGPGDINTDGNADLLAILGYDCMYKWLGNGAGGFAPRQLVGCGWDEYVNVATPGDLNRDGRPDLVAIHDDTNCMYRWYGDGRGSFHTGTKIGCGWEPYKYRMVGLDDVNGDDNGDLVARDIAGFVYAWYGLGAGGFTARHLVNGIILDNRVLVG